MSKNLVRFSQVPVGAMFKRYNALYRKIVHTGDMQGKAIKKDYRDNCLRLDNGKTERFQGSILVEVVEK